MIRRTDPSPPIDGGEPLPNVALVSWPADNAWRTQLHRAGQPRLLLIGADTDPPVSDDVLEDWVRISADPLEVQARVTALQLRAARMAQPRLDDSGRLHVGSRWLALSPIEGRLIALLLDHFAALVPQQALLRAGWPNSKPTRNNLDVHLARLRPRLEPLGLQLQTTRTRGYALNHAVRERFAGSS